MTGSVQTARGWSRMIHTYKFDLVELRRYVKQEINFTVSHKKLAEMLYEVIITPIEEYLDEVEVRDEEERE